MADSPPIACTLSSEDLRDREGAWVKLISSGLVEREAVPGGIRLSAAPGAAAALLELIELERECCARIEFDVRDGAVVTMTAAGDGEAVPHRHVRSPLTSDFVAADAQRKDVRFAKLR